MGDDHSFGTHGVSATPTFNASARRLSAAHAATKAKLDTFVVSANALGITSENLLFSHATEAPEMAYPEGRAPQITGFSSTTTLMVKTSDFSNVPEIMDAAVDAGLSTLEGIDYHATNLPEQKKKAREMAMAAAKDKAAQLAAGLGFKLGEMQSVSEQSENNPYHRMDNNVYQAVASAESTVDAALPIQPNSTPLTLTLNCVFAIE